MKKIELYQSRNQVLNDALDRCIVEIHMQKKKNDYTSFLLTGAGPMVGTTTLAIELAIALASSDFKTILVDVDMRKKAKYKRLNDTVEDGLSDYLNGTLEMNDCIYSTNWEQLHCIPCGEKGDSPVRLLCSTRMDDLMIHLYQNYDYVIYDTPSIEAAVDMSIMTSKTDAVILVAALGTTRKSALRDCKAKLEQDGANLIGVIVNKAPMKEYKNYLKHYDYFNKERYKKRKS